ncbi:hypothetical protein ABFS82_11G077000 [Erythranthe guttata]
MAIYNNKKILTFGILGNIMSFIVYLVPIYTFRKIWREKSSGGHTFMPYLVAFFSSTLWVYYGLLDRNGLIISINLFGCIIEIIYISIYYYYAPHNIRIKIAKITGLGLIVISVTIIVTYFTTHGQFRSSIVGWVGTIFSVVVFAGPIKAVVDVFKTRNNTFVPIQLLGCLALNGLVWLAFGLASKDVVIVICNVVGFLVCLFQMIVWWAFRQPI